MPSPARRTVLLPILIFDGLVLAAAIVMGWSAGDVHYHFDEHKFVTWISFFQLLLTALVSAMIYGSRRREAGGAGWRTPAMLWAVIAAGFLFMAVDELTLLHEGMDHRIQDLFGLKDGPFADRIDDLIVGVYGLVGLAVLYVSRMELRLCPGLYRYLTVGFVLLFLMVGLDTLSHRPDLITAPSVLTVMKVAEDSVKVVAEGVFAAGFAACWLQLGADATPEA